MNTTDATLKAALESLTDITNRAEQIKLGLAKYPVRDVAIVLQSGLFGDGASGDGNRHHEAKAASMGISADYVIWSNEHRAWWAPREQGYVRSLTEAGRYSQARAMAIAGSQWAMPFDGIPNEIAIRLDDALEQVRGPNR